MKLAEALLDLFFPPRCVACRELLSLGDRGAPLALGANRDPGSTPVPAESPLAEPTAARPIHHLDTGRVWSHLPADFCRRCSETLVELPEAHCRICAEPQAQDLCPHCQAQPPPFESARAPLLYGGAVADAVHRFKYEDRPHLAKPLARIVAAALPSQLEWCELVAPIPLHARRLRARGYDQALLLARELSRAAGKPLRPRALERIRATERQVGSERAARERNVAGAFVAVPSQVAGKRLLLVDDVLTTGATARAAALAARDAGAAAVRIVTVARAC